MTHRVSLHGQIDEVRREIAKRAEVYPRLVAKGAMRQAEADYLVARLQAVLTTLLWLADNERLIRQRLSYGDHA